MPRLAVLYTPSLDRETDMTSLCRALLMCAKSHFQPVFKERHIGQSLHIDEGHDVLDAKHSHMNPLLQST